MLGKIFEYNINFAINQIGFKMLGFVDIKKDERHSLKFITIFRIYEVYYFWLFFTFLLKRLWVHDFAASVG